MNSQAINEINIIYQIGPKILSHSQSNINKKIFD